MDKYRREVKKFLLEIKDEVVKREVITLYNYLTREFTNDMLYSQRDYMLGLIDEYSYKDTMIKCYNKENRLRQLLGLEPLAEIDTSIM